MKPWLSLSCHCEERQRRGNPEQRSGLPRPAKNAGLAMTLLFACAFTLLAGCGQTGKLYLPNQQVHLHDT